MILYSSFGSSCAWRVRAALRAKGIDYEYRPVNLRKNEQRDPEYLRVNAMAQVPTLVDGDNVITQSMAILEYLDETHPKPSMLPAHPAERATVRQICEIINAGIQPVQVAVFVRQGAEGLPWVQEVIERGLAAVEGVLEKTAGTCCVGDQLTLADCCLVPQVFFSETRFKVDTSKYPTITRLQNHLLQLPEFSETHPAKMVDCPPGLYTSAAASVAVEKGSQ